MMKSVLKRVAMGAMCLLAFPAMAADPVAPTASAGTAPVGNPSGSRPNILLILADDMGYSDIGCYGSEIHTPNIDALAAEGIRFTQFYNGARCCPSRASLLTGLYAHQVGVGGMTANDHMPGYMGKINDSCVTLAEMLKSAGYQTYMAGKWHVGAILPTQRGFDRFYGFYTGYTTNSWNPAQMALFPPGPGHSYAPGKFYATDAITDYALDFIHQGRSDPSKPWFTYLAYQAAHFPLMAPADEVAKYVPVYEAGWDKIRDARLARIKQLGLLPDSTVLPPRSMIPNPKIAAREGITDKDNPAWDTLSHDRQEDLAHRMAIYAAMVEHMDRDIGRVIDDLRAHNELHNTLIFFLSDNGACAEWAPYGFDVKLKFPPGDGTTGNGHGYDGNSGVPSILHVGADLDKMGQPDSTGIGYGSAWANACNTPFRLYKHYDHEGGISTPLIIHWPDMIPDKGTLRTQVGHLIDFMTTLVDVSGAKYPTDFNGHTILPMEGKSLVPALTNKPVEREALYWEHEGNRAVRMGDLKLVALAGHPWELYDMAKDRVELHDLSSTMPDQVTKMTAMWNAWAARCNVIKTRKGAPAPTDGSGDKND